jgi:hypothetical protein
VDEAGDPGQSHVTSMESRKGRTPKEYR